MGIIGDEKYRENLIENCSSLPNRTSCHFVASSKVVMKGLKKIRKRIGLASKTSFVNFGHSDGGFTAQPIRFHTTHGSNISLHENRTVAKRHASFCKGITFTDRPIRVNEKIYVKLIEKSDNWSGVIRFGFTICNPSTLKDCLPKYACPDLTNRKGFWAKAVNETVTDENSTMYFYVNKSGTVYFGFESPHGRRSENEFFTGVDIGYGPLWAMIDVYGNSTSVELVNVHLNNSLIADQEAGFTTNNLSTRNSKMRVELAPLSKLTATTAVPSNESLVGTNVFEPRRSPGAGLAATTSSIQRTSSPNIDRLVIRGEGFDSKLTPLPFHEKCGLNARLNDNNRIASRVDTEYGRGYVFTPHPVVANEFIVVEILKTIPDYVSGMAFGVTSANPAQIDTRDLPQDADELLDRSKSFIVYKNVANTPCVRDCLVFSMTENGEIRMRRNNEQDVSLFHVERDVPYWWFFDLYGSTAAIRAFISTIESPKKPNNCAVDNGINTSRSNSMQTSVAMPLPFSAANQRPRSVNHSSTSMPAEFSHEVAPPLMNKVNRVTHDTPPPVLVVKCFSNGYEPINIILQNQPAANRPISAPSAVQIPSSAACVVSNRTTNCGDASSLEKSKNREYQLQEWAKSNRRGPSTNGCVNECSVCYESAINAVLYPCGHMCMCYNCATNVWHRGGGHCPMCRASIVDVIKTYKS